MGTHSSPELQEMTQRLERLERRSRGFGIAAALLLILGTASILRAQRDRGSQPEAAPPEPTVVTTPGVTTRTPERQVVADLVKAREVFAGKLTVGSPQGARVEVYARGDRVTIVMRSGNNTPVISLSGGNRHGGEILFEHPQSMMFLPDDLDRLHSDFSQHLRDH